MTFEPEYIKVSLEDELTADGIEELVTVASEAGQHTGNAELGNEAKSKNEVKEAFYGGWHMRQDLDYLSSADEGWRHYIKYYRDQCYGQPAEEQAQYYANALSSLSDFIGDSKLQQIVREAGDAIQDYIRKERK